MKVYELMVIIKGSFDEDAAKKAADNVEKTIKAKQGTVTALDEWGKRKLAYQINKEDYGYYFVWRFTSDVSSTPADLQSTLKIQDEVLRSLVTLAPKKRAVKEDSEDKEKKATTTKSEKSTEDSTV